MGGPGVPALVPAREPFLLDSPGTPQQIRQEAARGRPPVGLRPPGAERGHAKGRGDVEPAGKPRGQPASCSLTEVCSAQHVCRTGVATRSCPSGDPCRENSAVLAAHRL